MALRSRLAHFLLDSNSLRTSSERQILIMLPEIYDLQYKIDWEGSALTFVNNLLKVLSEEGQETQLAFLKSLEEDFIRDRYGQEKIDEIANLRMEITSLTPDQWKAEFGVLKSEPSLQADLVEKRNRMELRRIKLSQELREARERLLDINFANSPTKPHTQVSEWLLNWDATFRKCNTLGHGMVNIQSSVMRELDGYEQEKDIEVFNELRPVFVGFIDMGLSILDQEYQVKPLLEEYIKRVKDTKLAVLLKEFDAVKNTAPNHVAVLFRTILCLVIQEKAKRVKPGSNTATRTDLSVDKMIDSARTDGILSGDEQRLLDSFKSTHKDIYDFVAHRPGADKLVDKSEVDTMVDLLNKLLPSIIN